SGVHGLSAGDGPAFDIQGIHRGSLSESVARGQSSLAGCEWEPRLCSKRQSDRRADEGWPGSWLGTRLCRAVEYCCRISPENRRSVHTIADRSQVQLSALACLTRLRLS